LRLLSFSECHIFLSRATKEAYDTDKMAAELTVYFQALPFTVQQPVCWI